MKTFFASVFLVLYFTSIEHKGIVIEEVLNKNHNANAKSELCSQFHFDGFNRTTTNVALQFVILVFKLNISRFIGVTYLDTNICTNTNKHCVSYSSFVMF